MSESSSTKHTPMPWSIDQDGKTALITSNGELIAECGISDLPVKQDQANAAFIVRAEHHDELVAALRELLDASAPKHKAVENDGGPRGEASIRAWFARRDAARGAAEALLARIGA